MLPFSTARYIPSKGIEIPLYEYIRIIHNSTR
jgi:hypothetical protein